MPHGSSEQGYLTYRKPSSSYNGGCFSSNKGDMVEIKVTEDVASCDCDSDLDLGDSLRRSP
jgi:hypothetical protein